MGLYFKNETGQTTWIVFGYAAPACDGVQWAKKGWYPTNPGQTIKVMSGSMSDQTFFYYAESDGGTWSGEYFTGIPQQSFDWCWNTSSTSSRQLGMRLRYVDKGIADFTLRLTS